MRREERVTVQGPVKEQQPDGMSHRGGGVRVRVTTDEDFVLLSLRAYLSLRRTHKTPHGGGGGVVCCFGALH